MNHSPSSSQHTQVQQSKLSFPLTVKVKLLSISDQLYVEKPTGRQAAFARKKLLKLKEEIEVFSNKSKKRLLYTIKADRVIDFSAKYHFYSVQDGLIGSTKQQGFKSIWKTQFDVLDNTGTRFFIKHKNPWVEMLESLLMMIPIIGLFLSILSGYMLNPVYEVTDLQGNELAEMRLKPSFFESKFEMTRLANIEQKDQELIVLSLLTLIFMQADQDDGDSGLDF